MTAVQLPLCAIPADMPTVYRDRLLAAQRTMRFGFNVITRELADLYLTYCNDHNRPCVYWKKIAKSLSSLGIEINGESVVISYTGRLLNGQNRCKAVVSTGVPFPTLQVWGVPDSTFATFDSGTGRKSSDVLAMIHQQYPKSLAAAVGWQLAYDANDMEGVRPSIPNDAIIATVETYPELPKSVALANTKFRKKGFPPSLLGFLHYQFNQRDESLTDRFFKRVNLGIDCPEVSHEFKLRRRIEKATSAENKELRGRKRSNKSEISLSSVEMAALSIKTWNRMRRGEECDPNKSLVWKVTEKFPTIE